MIMKAKELEKLTNELENQYQDKIGVAEWKNNDDFKLFPFIKERMKLGICTPFKSKLITTV